MKVFWKRTTSDFSYTNYNRDHTWDFGNENIFEASAAKEFRGDEGLVDPELAHLYL